MKIYTRTGDEGSTGLFGGPRVCKDDARIEAYGTVDELNAAIGVARSVGLDDQLDAQLSQIQRELFSLGAELATPYPDEHQLRIISEVHIQRLEGWMDESESELPALKHFILPSGHPGSTALHLARATCRRAERRVVTLSRQAATEVSANLVIYLNRLSDWLFVATRLVNHRAGLDEVVWTRPD